MQSTRPSTALTSCTFRAQLRGDPQLGTAFPAARVLLVEQAGPWGHRGLRDSRFPTDAAAALETRAGAAGFRVQTIRRPGRTDPAAIRSWATADTRRGQEAVRWGSFTDPSELLDLPLDGTAGVQNDDPVYLVCTHGGHDPCCALRGRSVVDALRATRPGRVWETTHLGGDRFAANVLVLPSGLLYGRVLPIAIRDFIRAAEADEVLTPLLRGQVGRTPAEQAALAYAHDQLGLTRRADVRVTGSARVSEARVQVDLDTSAGPHQVDVDVRRVDADGLTCSNPGPNVYLEHRAARIRPAAVVASEVAAGL